MSAEWVLLNAHAYPGRDSHRNATTASATTGSHQTIEVSFSPSRPPLPSNLFIHCPELDGEGEDPFTILPRIVRALEDLLLICVPTPLGPQRPRDYVSSLDSCDYFIYRADPERPSLTRLLPPHPFYCDDDIGLLRRDSDHYTIAILLATPRPGVYNLHRFRSETGRWLHGKVTVGEPPLGFPLKIPMKAGRLFYHLATTVIAIGGDHGTMGWADLWSGILFCDVQDDEPMLRGVPLPLPQERLACIGEQEVELGCPKSVRGIAFIRGPDNTAYLKLVHLEHTAIHTYRVEGPGGLIMCDWAITTWSNTKMTSSREDWHLDHRVQASNLRIDSELSSKLMHYGLLHKPQGGVAGAERALQNLLVSNPSPGIVPGHEDVVYLMARVNILDPDVWALAIDTRNNKLLGAAEFGTERQAGVHAMYCSSTISRYINPETAPGLDAEGSKHEANA